MNTHMDWSMFEKIEINTRSRTIRRKSISIDKGKRKISISRDIAEEAGIAFGDRFDLYRVGKTFALKKAKVGVLKVSSNNNCFIINSSNACIEILAMNGGCRENEAWVEKDVIFFKPIEKEGEK